jgi:hypothetical protein
LSFQKSGLATSASSSATRSRLLSMSKKPPQLSELALEAFHYFNLFAKHQCTPKVDNRTANYNRRLQTEQGNLPNFKDFFEISWST